jgi:DnaJ domain
MTTAGVGAIPERRVNLYEVLQVSSNACPEVVQAAYRALARSYHPDVNPSPEAARQMKQLNAAYSVLSDPTRRARYDAFRARPMRARRGDPTPVTQTVDGSPAAGATRTRANTYVVRPVSSVVSVPPQRAGGPRTGRVFGVLTFAVLIIVALIYALWLVAGILEDEPRRLMAPTNAMTRSTVSQLSIDARSFALKPQ